MLISPVPARLAPHPAVLRIRSDTLRAVIAADLLTRARRAAGISQEALARRAGTSRPTLSAYEHGHKSPNLETAARIAGAAGFDLALQPRIEFVVHPVGRGRPVTVPTTLPRLPVEQALAVTELPLHLNWSAPGRQFDLRDRVDRARVYEILLREGTADDILRYVDGALLVDLWDELVVPPAIRSAWARVIEPALAATPRT